MCLNEFLEKAHAARTSDDIIQFGILFNRFARDSITPCSPRADYLLNSFAAVLTALKNYQTELAAEMEE